MLNRAKYYYENDKARNKYRNVSEEDKNKKRAYGENRYHNMSKKRSKNWKNIKNKDIEKQKSLRIMNKIVYLL